MKIFTTIVFAISMLMLACWGVGQIFSDRWEWSQWLLWIPTVAVLVLLLCTIVLLAIQKRKMYTIVLSLVFDVLLVQLVFVEHRMFANSKCVGQISISGWTMSHSKKVVSKESGEIIVAMDADITLLTHAWYVRGEESVQNWMQSQGRILINGPFTLCTKFQPITVRSLVAADGIYISEFVLDTTAVLGKPLTVWAVDLPSKLSLPRRALSREVVSRMKFAEKNSPDIVLGDFNMTRNSSAIRTMFPALHDAADEGGIGLLATFPMHFPLYHIDHILLSETLQACSYECINPHIGRHRMQFATIAKHPSEGIRK